MVRVTCLSPTKSYSYCSSAFAHLELLIFNLRTAILGSLLGGHRNLKILVLSLGSAHKNDVVHGPSEVIVSWDVFAPPLLERFEWLPHIFTFSRVPKWMGKLGNLCILKISVRELLKVGVTILGELHAPTALSLYVQIAPLKRIVFDKTGFSVLKYFKFMCTTVPWLKFEVDAMPNLQRLKLGFSAQRVYQHSSRPISIEHLPSLKEISAKVGDASPDAETALVAAVSNHPRNPRIRVQLVDWNFHGDRVWYMVSKQKEAKTLEDVMLEEGLDEHCGPQEEESRDNENDEGHVRHSGVKRSRKVSCTKSAKGPDASTSPSIIGERLVPSSSVSEPSTVLSSLTTCTSEARNPQQRNSNITVCQFPGCVKRAIGSSGCCIAHIDGKRCQKPGGQKGAVGRTIYCKAHGGGRRCEFLGCTKNAEGRTDYCIAHGGGRRCILEGCFRAARGKSGFCIRHGGGKRCQRENCTKSAEGRSGFCIAHGGGRRCQFPDCAKGAQGSTMFCKAHGGGKRCTFLGCTRGAEGSTPLCRSHGGGKRCAFQGGGVCPKSVHGGSQFCVDHGGRKRCAISGCTKSARGHTDYCIRHGGGKRCMFEGCSRSVQGSTDFCKAHGAAKRCSWGQVDSSFGRGSQQCDRFARGKTGLCSVHMYVVQDRCVIDSDASSSVIQQFSIVPSEMKATEVKGDAHEKTSDDARPSLGLDSSVQSLTNPIAEGRIHGAELSG